jgi:hypothetical protein
MRENLKLDEVLIKGGKKGVAGAKAEILDVRISSTHGLTFILTYEQGCGL